MGTASVIEVKWRVHIQQTRLLGAVIVSCYSLLLLQLVKFILDADGNFFRLSA